MPEINHPREILLSELRCELDGPQPDVNADYTEVARAAQAVRLLARLEQDAKTVARRISTDGTWPHEIRAFLRFVREKRDSLEERHPELMK